MTTSITIVNTSSHDDEIVVDVWQVRSVLRHGDTFRVGLEPGKPITIEAKALPSLNTARLGVPKVTVTKEPRDRVVIQVNGVTLSAPAETSVPELLREARDVGAIEQAFLHELRPAGAPTPYHPDASILLSGGEEFLAVPEEAA